MKNKIAIIASISQGLGISLFKRVTENPLYISSSVIAAIKTITIMVTRRFNVLTGPINPA